MANDGWSKIYLEHQRSQNYGVTLFFLSLLIVGQFFLLNLFIAILIENFEQLSVRHDLTNKLYELSKASFIQKVKNTLFFWRKPIKI